MVGTTNTYSNSLRRFVADDLDINISGLEDPTHFPYFGQRQDILDIVGIRNLAHQIRSCLCLIFHPHNPLFITVREPCRPHSDLPLVLLGESFSASTTTS